MSTVKAINLQHPTSSNANIVLNSSGHLLANTIGIGTNAPGYKLHVEGTIFSGREDSVNEGGQIGFGRSSDNTQHYAIDVYGSGSTPSLRFIDAAAGVVRMDINSSGIITKPYQPVWVAYGSSESWYNSVGVVPFNYSNYTRNCTYDTTNYRFTAPVTGVYNISWSFLAGTNGNGGHISLRKNGSYICELMHGQSSAAEYDYTGGSYPLNMAAGDYVDMYMSATFSQGIYMGANAGRYAFFAGFLVG